MFEIGDRVKVITSYRDCYFFHKNTGVIIRINLNTDGSLKYLGIIVEFDEPIEYTDGYIKTIHNFHPEDLELV